MIAIDKDKPCPECGRYDNRGITVDAVICNAQNEILLIKRGSEPFKDFWGLVGGYMEWDESAEEAVKREVKEEVGLEVTEVSLIGAYTHPHRHPKQAISLAFAVTTKGEPIVGDDAIDFRWISPDYMPPELAFDHKQIIDDFLKTL